MRLPVSWHLACTSNHTRILMAVINGSRHNEIIQALTAANLARIVR